MDRRSFLKMGGVSCLTGAVPQGLFASENAPSSTLTTGVARSNILGSNYPNTEVWGFNGTVPGSPLRITLGDKIDLLVDNQLSVPTSVHWHGIRLPNAMDGVAWPFSLRPPLAVWKAMYFDPTRQIADGNRGEYLVNGPTHCTECHSPRNLLGGLSTLALSGNQRGPDGHAVPGITASDLAEWTKEDIELFLEIGITLSGDFTGGHMTDVVEYSTSELTMDDRSAIADYLLSDANQP